MCHRHRTLWLSNDEYPLFISSLTALSPAGFSRRADDDSRVTSRRLSASHRSRYYRLWGAWSIGFRNRFVFVFLDVMILKIVFFMMSLVHWICFNGI